MHHAGTMMTEILFTPPTPTAPHFEWQQNEQGGKSVSISNPNDAQMSVAMNAWTGDAGFAWSVGSITIPARSSANLSATFTTSVPDIDKTASATGTWSVTGGGSGNMSATGTKWGTV